MGVIKRTKRRTSLCEHTFPSLLLGEHSLVSHCWHVSDVSAVYSHPFFCRDVRVRNWTQSSSVCKWVG